MKSKRRDEKRGTFGIRAEYKETLYSTDFVASPTPPRKEWEHISVVEEKIDKMYRETPKSEKKKMDRKIDKLLSKKK